MRERVLTFTCTRWLQDFNKRLSEARKPEKLVMEFNDLISFTLIQLSQLGEPRKSVFAFFKILDAKNPLNIGKQNALD